jgi:hypothetical protein
VCCKTIIRPSPQQPASGRAALAQHVAEAKTAPRSRKDIWIQRWVAPAGTPMTNRGPHCLKTSLGTGTSGAPSACAVAAHKHALPPNSFGSVFPTLVWRHLHAIKTCPALRSFRRDRCGRWQLPQGRMACAHPLWKPSHQPGQVRSYKWVYLFPDFSQQQQQQQQQHPVSCDVARSCHASSGCMRQ